MGELVAGVITALVVGLVGGFFGLPWLNRRNASKSTDADTAAKYDALAQRYLDRYEADLDEERRERAIDQQWIRLLVQAMREAGMDVPDRPSSPDRKDQQ